LGCWGGNFSRIRAVDARGFSAADLIVGKCHAVLAREDDWLRIVDESGEDRLYPATGFVPVALAPEAVARLRH
jgi:hypothetical protein